MNILIKLMAVTIVILVYLFLSKKYPFDSDEESKSNAVKSISGQYGNEIGTSCPTRHGAGSWCEYSMICGKSYYLKSNPSVRRQLKGNGDIVDENGTKHGHLQIPDGKNVHFVHDQAKSTCVGNMFFGSSKFSFSTEAGRQDYDALPRIVFSATNIWCQCRGNINNCNTRLNC